MASPGLSRRSFLQLAGAGCTAAAVATLLPGADATGAPLAPAGDLAADTVAQTYHRVLLRHTRWAETQWDAAAGHYVATDFSFAVVLGNALVLTRGDYDSDLAGIDADTLRAHTLATMTHFAASNRLTGGDEWGKTLFFDTTFQLYFQLAGRLLWDELDNATRANLDTIAAAQAAYTTALGTGDDPLSGSWTPNGLQGGWVGDTKLEEMGVYAQSLAPGLAWAPGHDGAADWAAAYGRWSRNETGLPPADLANPTVVDGVAVSANTAHNLYDTFLVENHGSFGPHYQCELWRTSARNAVHFLTAARPLPEVLTHQPNGERLWRSVLGVMSDAGEPLMPMVADREHLYGRDVIPLAFLAQVQGDRRAAFAEAALAQRLEAYQAYPPEYRVTKFSGEPKYEPEARAEIAISYLLHEWRARTAAVTAPLTADAFWRAAAGLTDFGAGPGLVSHQSRAAWAGAVSKPGFVKFAWQPQHDDWLFRLSGSTPMFLPSAGVAVHSRSVRTYERVRDGYDASVTVLEVDGGTAAFATLPGGATVYATTGTGAGEGHVEVVNLTMPGVAGLDGARDYAAAEGSVTVAAADAKNPPAGVARVDTLTFAATTTRWVRVLGVTPDPTYGYSIIEFEARDGADGPDLALGRPTTASSADTGRAAGLATDGNLATRWAVSRTDRPRADSWLAVDLGPGMQLDRVTVDWEAAAGRAYAVQVSDDGSSWTTVATYPHPDLRTTGGWLAVDAGRAGFVVRGSANPITVTGDVLTLSDGPAAGSAGMTVEAYPGLDARATAARHADPAPTAATLRTSFAEHHLTLLNLTGEQVRQTVSLPQRRSTLRLYAGHQVVSGHGSELTAAVPARDGAVLAPWFTLAADPAGADLPEGLQAVVLDARTVRLAGGQGRVRVTATQNGRVQVVRLDGGQHTVVFRDVAAYAGGDLAIGRTTFPTTPLPAGMSDPANAVDGDPHTAWTPGPAGRMVVDLGDVHALGTLVLQWTAGHRPAATIAASDDGRDYRDIATLGGGTASAALDTSARYVAVSVPGWRAHDAALTSVTIRPA